MKRIHRASAFAFAGLMSLGFLTTPLAARASEEGKRNTALALGAVAAGLLLTQRDKTPGIVAGVGAAIAFSNLGDRHRGDRDHNWDDRDDHGYRNRERFHRDDHGDFRGRGNDHRNDRHDRR